MKLVGKRTSLDLASSLCREHVESVVSGGVGLSDKVVVPTLLAYLHVHGALLVGLHPPTRT